MEIKEFQKEILQVFNKIPELPNRREYTKQSALIHLFEEAGEVARQVNSEYHRPEKFDKINLGTELADLMMFIMVLSNLYEIDISMEMKNGIERVKNKINKAKQETQQNAGI